MQFRERSGLNQLEVMLERSIATREDVRLANILQLVGIVLNEAIREQHATIRAANGDAGIETEMAAKQLAIEQLGSKQARWRGSLQNSIQRMQATLNRTVARELNLVRSHYRDVLTNPAEIEQLTATLPAGTRTVVVRGVEQPGRGRQRRAAIGSHRSHP